LTPVYPSVTEFALAFLLFRLFDILKPWPISAAEKLPGGLGVMADDMVAGLTAAIIAGALQYFRVV
jgi:phosphatidylglycerophosphatase A